MTELEAWASPDSDRGVVPDQLVFVSNAFLSAVPGSGGLDAVTKEVDDWLRALRDTSAEDHLDSRG